MSLISNKCYRTWGLIFVWSFMLIIVIRGYLKFIESRRVVVVELEFSKDYTQPQIIPYSDVKKKHEYIKGYREGWIHCASIKKAVVKNGVIDETLLFSYEYLDEYSEEYLVGYREGEANAEKKFRLKLRDKLRDLDL